MSNKYYINKPSILFISFKYGIFLSVFIFLLYFLLAQFTPTNQEYIKAASTQSANIEAQNKNTVYQNSTIAPPLKNTIEEIIPLITEVPTPNSIPTDTPSPLPTPFLTLKKTYKIAIYGDSMEDTMGDFLEFLNYALKRKYPNTQFILYNYGIGSQNALDGLERFCKAYNTKNRQYPPLCNLKPDIIILGSFAYNPFYPYDRNKHWIVLSQLIAEAKKTSSNVYLLAEIAPLRKDFGKGKNGVNWNEYTATVHADRIIQQLENTIGLSKTLQVPIIDAFTITQVNSTKEGIKKYVNLNDGIHPSVLGHRLMAELIAETIEIK